jgi:hypothetical protein
MKANKFKGSSWLFTLFMLRIMSRIRMFLGLLDPDPLVRGTDPDPDPEPFPAPDPSIIKQK